MPKSNTRQTSFFSLCNSLVSVKHCIQSFKFILYVIFSLLLKLFHVYAKAGGVMLSFIQSIIRSVCEQDKLTNAVMDDDQTW